MHLLVGNTTQLIINSIIVEVNGPFVTALFVYIGLTNSYGLPDTRNTFVMILRVVLTVVYVLNKVFLCVTKHDPRLSNGKQLIIISNYVLRATLANSLPVRSQFRE